MIHVMVVVSAKEREQLVLVPRRRSVELEAGFDHVLGIERVRVIEPYTSGIGPPILIGCGSRTGVAMGVFAARIGQDVIGIGGERRPAVPEVTGYAHELRGIHVVSPHQVRVLVALQLVFINLFRRRWREIRIGVVLDQIDNMLILHLPRFRGNLRVRHAVQEQPGDVIAVVNLVIATQEGLVGFAVPVKDRLAQRGRINRPVGRLIVVHHVISEFVPYHPSVFKRRQHGLVRAAEYAD